MSSGHIDIEELGKMMDGLGRNMSQDQLQKMVNPIYVRIAHPHTHTMREKKFMRFCHARTGGASRC
jgi:Ca2+-binding EF-hand superfamily protein